MKNKDFKYLVVYHQEDNDGVLSAAMAADYLLNGMKIGRDEIDFYPANYNKLSEQFKTKKSVREYFGTYGNVIFTDISFNDPAMMEEVNDVTHLVWVDHHKPIIEEMNRRGFDEVHGVRDWTKSAILNMWQYLYDPFNAQYLDGKAPILLRYLSAWDSFSYEREGFELEDCMYINEAVNFEYQLNLEKLIERIGVFLSTTSIDDGSFIDLYEEGRKLVEKKEESDRQFVEKYGEGGWTVRGSRTAIACVSSGQTNSTMFKSVSDKYQNAIVFKREANGNWVISMYNIKEDHSFHCGKYLKENYGGGGHEGAAGCTIKDIDTICRLFKEKAI